MGTVLNCCQKNDADRANEITIEPPVQKKDAQPQEAGTSSAVSTAPTPAAGDAEHPETFGSTDFHELFIKMKENSDKEITTRESKKDPPGSHAAMFWVNE